MNDTNALTWPALLETHAKTPMSELRIEASTSDNPTQKEADEEFKGWTRIELIVHIGQEVYGLS